MTTPALSPTTPAVQVRPVDTMLEVRDLRVHFPIY